MYRHGLLTYSEGMKDSVKEVGMKALALVVLLLAAFILLRVVIGLVMGAVWLVLGVLALLAILWALNRIL